MQTGYPLAGRNHTSLASCFPHRSDLSAAASVNPMGLRLADDKLKSGRVYVQVG